MAKMSEVAPVTEHQLVQLASVALAVSRSENVPITAALQWLRRQVDDNQLPSRLFSLPMSPGEQIATWAPDGDKSQWSLIEKKAVERQVDADKMPTLAQSRYLHVEDVAKLAASADTSEACRAALLELVERRQLTPRSGPVPVPLGAVRNIDPAATPMTDTAGAPVKAAGKRWTPKCLDDLGRYREAHGTKAAAEKFGISDSRVRELLPREKSAPKGYSAFNPRLK